MRRALVVVVVLAACATPIEIPGTEGNTTNPGNNYNSGNTTVRNNNVSIADASWFDAGGEQDLPSTEFDGMPPPAADQDVSFSDAAGDAATDAIGDGSNDAGDALTPDALSPDGAGDASPDDLAADVSAD